MVESLLIVIISIFTLLLVRAKAGKAALNVVIEHEAGHIIVGRYLGCKVKSVTVHPNCYGSIDIVRRKKMTNEECTALMVSGLVAARRANQGEYTEEELLEQAKSDFEPLERAKELGLDIEPLIEKGTKLAERILEDHIEEYQELVNRIKKENHIDF